MHRTSVVSVLAVLAALTACAHRSVSDIGDAMAMRYNAALVVVEARGGFAALSTEHTIRHDDRSFSFVQRHICSASCPPPIDTASGTLSRAAADSVFDVVTAASPFTLRDDYGTTPNSADMMAYTVRVTVGRTTKVIRADEGTMPPPLRRIVEAVRGTIGAAARR